MLPFIRDPAKLPSITAIYSGWSSVVFIVTACLLFSSKKYLKFGDFEILPLLGFYTISELIKWAFINSKFHLYPPFRPKLSTGVSSEIIKQLKNVGTFNLLKSGGVIIGGVVFYYVLAIFFGAAVFEGLTQTFMFSLLMTVLTVLPLCLNMGHESVYEFIDGACPVDSFHWLLYRGVLMTWVGAWFGAFAIPLDWSRKWQVWPIPCCYGAIIALATYHVLSCMYHMGLYTRTNIFNIVFYFYQLLNFAAIE